MTIKQALKYKNKLASKMNAEFTKASTYNSIEEGSNRAYDVRESMDKYLKMSAELVELKTKIHLANTKVYSKIFELSELKSQISKIQYMDCGEGKQLDRYSRMSGEPPVIKTAIIGIVERDQMVQAIEDRIELLQEELDFHNATTTI